MLSKRRFPDTVTRKRQGMGSRNQYGEFVPGTVSETLFQASVQPLENSDNDTEAGSRAVRRRRVYIPVRDALRGATDTEEADTVELPDGLII